MDKRFSRRRGQKLAAQSRLARSAAITVEQMEQRLLLIVHPLTDIPILHSRPQAAHVIYLDFNGAAAFPWNADIPPDLIPDVNPDPPWETIPLEHGMTTKENDLDLVSVPSTAAYSTDDNRLQFTDAEINDITGIWSRVAEFFSPFNVDVTTIDPGNTTNSTNLRVIIGGDGGWRESTAPLFNYFFPRGEYVDNGAAAYKSFTDPAKDNTVFVFSDLLDTRKEVSETIAHQVGVSMGLLDQALWTLITPVPPIPGAPQYTDMPPNPFFTHDPGTDDFELGPIMGDPSGTARAVWWDGDITKAQSPTPPFPRTHGFQNDLQILYAVLGEALDDHDESFLASTLLQIGVEQAGTNQTGASGVIETATDRDSFKFSTVAGTVTFTITNANGGAGMLTPWVEIRDYFGNVLARETNNLDDQPEVTISATLVEGTYTLDIFAPDQPGPGSSLKLRYDPGFDETTGLEDPRDRSHFAVAHDVIGQYTITGTIPQGVVDDPFSGADLVFGSTASDKITITRDPDGRIRNNVNGVITFFDPTVNPLDRIIVIADAGVVRVVSGSADKIVIGHDVPRAYILAGGGYDTVQGGDFNDTIVGGGGSKANLIYGELGDDRVTMSGKGGFTFGGPGNDRLYGSSNSDEIHGDAGNDRIYGNNGNDVVVGGAGNDTIYGGDGNDTLFGQDGNDLITGDAGFDTVYGNLGNDTFYMRDRSADSIIGGAGTDSAQIDPDDEPDDPLNGDKTDEIEIFLN